MRKPSGRRRSRRSNVERAPRASTSLADRCATSTMNAAAGRIASPASKVGVAEHVLQELLPDEHRSHQRAEDDDPRAGRDPEGGCVRRRRDRRAGSSPDAGGCRSRSARRRRSPSSPSTSVPLFGTGAKLIATISAATSSTRKNAAEVVDGIGRLVHIGSARQRTASTSATAASGNVIRKTDPHQKCSSSQARRTRGRARKSHRRAPTESAIDFVRPGPDQSAVIRASVVG